MTTFSNRTFDDRDTTNLRYGGWWFLTGTWNATSVEETGTLSSSSDPFANVTFTFPEPAQAFYFYAIPRCCGGLYKICIDCDPDNPMFETIDAVNVTDNGSNPPVVLYSKRFKTPGIHEIILKNANDSRYEHSQLTIDRFELEVPTDGTEGKDESSSTRPSAYSTTSNGATSSGAALPHPTSSSSSSSSSSPSSSVIGAIVGAVLASVAIIAIVAFIIFRFSRKRRNVMSEKPGGRGHITAFVDSPSNSSPISQTSRNTFIPSSKADEHAHVQRQASSSSSVAIHQRPRERDAGRMETDDLWTLPPDYHQVFSPATENDDHTEDPFTITSPVTTSPDGTAPSSSLPLRPNR